LRDPVIAMRIDLRTRSKAPNGPADRHTAFVGAVRPKFGADIAKKALPTQWHNRRF
jgi:hypothetical protein